MKDLYICLPVFTVFFFGRKSENLVPDQGNGDRHQRGNEVEQTVGEVFQRGHFQHR